MRRPTLLLMLAVAAAFLAAIVVFSALRNREAEMRKAIARSVDIVVAAREIPLGTKIDRTMLKLVHWSRDSLPEGAYTDVSAVSGNLARADFVEGQPILAKMIFNADKAAGVMPMLIPAGMRAMAVPVDEVSDIAGFVK